MELSGVTAGESRDQFLQLLVTQLQHQDPLEPIKQEDFLAQLAQFSTLEGIESISSTLDRQAELQEDRFRFRQLADAATLVGLEVEYSAVNDEGAAEIRRGIVESVQQNEGQIELTIGNDSINWHEVRALRAQTKLNEPASTNKLDGEPT